MKALSIKQPWVHGILREGKNIENRSWQRNFRGWLALHASARPEHDAKFPRAFKFPTSTLSTTRPLSLNQLAELFQRDKSVISRHIKNVFEEDELRPEGTVAKSATVQIEGGKQVTREIEFCFFEEGALRRRNYPASSG